jgi:hypothetical protein
MSEDKIRAEATAVAYMRRWAFDGETPTKVKSENGRWKWPYKFKLLALTQHKILQDDVALYAAPQPPTDDRVRELLKDALLDCISALEVCPRDYDYVLGKAKKAIDQAMKEANQ